MQWEYLLKTAENPLSLEEMNSLGKLGWELVAVNERVTHATGRGYIYHFKRERKIVERNINVGPMVLDAKADTKAYLEASQAAKEIPETLDSVIDRV